MIDYQVWVREELERAAREEIREYLLAEATRWVAGDGISSAGYLHRLEELGWIGQLAEAVGEDRARAIQAEVVAVHLDELAAQARLAVPDAVVDAWVTRERIARNGTERPVLTVDGQVEPAKAVRDGLQWLFRVRCDRDLFDQSGLPESQWDGRG